MKEDELTNALISWKSKVKRCQRVEPEFHYSYYGERGVADLFSRDKEANGIFDSVREIKANPENANKVIRQFNRMLNYFYKGTDLSKPDESLYELCFLATQSNLNHVQKNKEMYQSVFENHKDVIITFRHPQNITPVHAFSSKINIGEEDWWEHAKVVGNHSKLAGVKQ